MGKDGLDDDTKEEISVVFDGSNYPEILSPKKLNGVMKNIHRSWDETAYFRLLKQFSLPPEKRIKQFSKGMKMKLAISVALSHHSKLLILDEATSGLDPVIRDDILDMLLDFVQVEDHSILVSSHITSDLEKIADYIVFIHAGKVVFSKSKDELVEQYGIIKCGAAQFDALEKPILSCTEKWTMNGRFWYPTGRRCGRNIPRPWSFRPPLTKSCCSM